MTSDECVDAVADAVAAHLAGNEGWTVARRVRWDGDLANPQMPFTWDVAVYPADAPLELTPGGGQLSAAVEPIFLFDLASDDWERDNYDKPDVIHSRRVGEWVLFDPSGLQIQPAPMALRWDGEGHREIFPVVDDVYFSSLGFRLEVNKTVVRLTPSGSPSLEERRIDLRERLVAATAKNEDTRRKVEGLTAALAHVEAELNMAGTP